MKLLDVVLAGLLFGAAHGVVAAEYVEEEGLLHTTCARVHVSG